ncbi:hypothetical protein BDQ17DRAFT_1547643 [Cyathus striatus]|nr:hypothetical protein BDQ17DRAFT_1547643 [Cyathus striatus]
MSAPISNLKEDAHDDRPECKYDPGIFEDAIVTDLGGLGGFSSPSSMRSRDAKETSSYKADVDVDRPKSRVSAGGGNIDSEDDEEDVRVNPYYSDLDIQFARGEITGAQYLSKYYEKIGVGSPYNVAGVDADRSKTIYDGMFTGGMLGGNKYTGSADHKEDVNPYYSNLDFQLAREDVNPYYSNLDFQLAREDVNSDYSKLAILLVTGKITGNEYISKYEDLKERDDRSKTKYDGWFPRGMLGGNKYTGSADNKEDVNADFSKLAIQLGTRKITDDEYISEYEDHNVAGVGLSTNFSTSTNSPENPSPGQSGSNEVTTHTPTSVQDGNVTYISGQSLFFAEGAIEHAKKQENKIRSIFAGLGIGSECYTISAGFNELLIREGGACLEEIHIYIGSSAQIYFKSVYFSDFLASLGKIISPFPGSVYVGDDKPVPTPVFNDEGDKWNFDDMVMEWLCKQRSEGPKPIIITFNDDCEQEKPNSGNNVMGGSNSAGGSSSIGESSGQGTSLPSDPSGSRNAGDNGNEGEDEDGGNGVPEDPGKSKEPPKLPRISFAMVAYISKGLTKYEDNLAFAALSMETKFTLFFKEKKCTIDFKQLKVQQPTLPDAPPGPYRLSSVIVRVNAGYKDAIVKTKRVRTTPGGAGEIRADSF